MSCSGDGSKGSPTAGEGGLGGAGDDEDEDLLEIVARTPEAGDDNGWALGPIEVEFSSALDLDTVAGAIRIEAGGEAVPFTAIADEAPPQKVRLLLEEVPLLPARVQIEIGPSLRSTSGAAFAGDAWHFDFPLWQTPSAPESVVSSEEGGLGLTVLADREVLVAYGSDDGLHLGLLTGQLWATLTPPSLVDETATPGVVGLWGSRVEDATVAWLERVGDEETLYVARFDGDEWQTIGGGAAAAGSELLARVRQDGAGKVTVAYRSGANEITVRRADADTWQAVGEPLPATGVRELALALDEAGEPLVAFVNDDGSVQVARGGEDWDLLGAAIERQRTGSAQPQVAWADGGAVVAYVDGDGVSTHVQTARFDGVWQPVGGALDLDIDADASNPRLFVAEDGALFASWRERRGPSDRVLTARQVGSGWRFWGPSPGSGRNAAAFALGVDADGNLHVGWVVRAQDEATVHVHRFNGSPELPFGLGRLGDRGACAIPSDTDPDFPETLSATGCYEDVSAQRVVDAAVPYSINSVLWSDGADKRRYVLLPEEDGEPVPADYVSMGALGFPVGTIVIKEFYLERVVGDPSTLFPVETRFLVKRCEEGTCATPWQGYTYEWNAAGTEGTLLDGLDEYSRSWMVTDAGAEVSHVHLYPSRAQCELCHNEPAGRMLGLQAKQLNKAHDYGHTIDNQLRAWLEAGLLTGSAVPTGPLEAEPRLPRPADVGRSLEERARSYFHSNCSHCHRAGGTNVAVDFRYEAPAVAEGNICNLLEPGDHEQSRIWQRDSTRDALQMPPLATVLPDTRQLAITAAWIDSMVTCP